MTIDERLADIKKCNSREQVWDVVRKHLEEVASEKSLTDLISRNIEVLEDLSTRRSKLEEAASSLLASASILNKDERRVPTPLIETLRIILGYPGFKNKELLNSIDEFKKALPELISFCRSVMLKEPDNIKAIFYSHVTKVETLSKSLLITNDDLKAVIKEFVIIIDKEPLDYYTQEKITPLIKTLKEFLELP